MTCATALRACAAAAVGGGLLTACGGGGSDDARSRASDRLSDSALRLTSQDRSRTLGPASFCAAPNGEPITLACGGRITAPRRRALPVRPGAPVRLRFGVAVERVEVRYHRVTHDGRVLRATYARPVRPARPGRSWRTVIPRDPALRRPRTVAIFSVLYRDPVRLRVGDRLSRPFEDASAEFAVRLAHRGARRR